ncbi:MAG: rod shape-determining protein MreD [Gemmatimonadota bacterium]
MKLTRAIRAAILFLILVALHFLLLPLLDWRVSMDFLVIAILLGAVRMRPGSAALLGFVTGLLADSVTPASFGAGALALTILGFSASWLKALFFSDNFLLHAFFFFVGKWAYDIIYAVAQQGSGRPFIEVLVQLVLWSPLAAALTAVTGLAVLLLFRGMLETGPS